MNSKELIKATKECVANHWNNSDIPRNNEVLLEMMSEHFENCEECRIDFDNAQFTGETLIEFSSKYLSSIVPSEWICDSREVEINEKETIDSYDEWAKRVYLGTEIEHIGEEVDQMRIARFEKRETQRAIQKTFPFRLRTFFGLECLSGCE